MPTMFSLKTLTPQLAPGLEFSQNDESELSTETKSLLLSVLGWMFSDSQDQKDIFKATLGSLPTGPSSNLNVAKTIKDLRGATRHISKQITVYKYLYASTFDCTRSPKELVTLLKGAREILEISNLQAAIVHDSLLGEHVTMPGPAHALSEQDRVSIVALCCLLLRLDGSTHVLETEALRAITGSLQTGAIQPATLMASMGKEPLNLYKGLQQNAHPWALNALLRIGAADGTIRPKELEFILALANDPATDPKQFAVVTKAQFFESGLVLPKVI